MCQDNLNLVYISSYQRVNRVYMVHGSMHESLSMNCGGSPSVGPCTSPCLFTVTTRFHGESAHGSVPSITCSTARDLMLVARNFEEATDLPYKWTPRELNYISSPLFPFPVKVKYQRQRHARPNSFPRQASESPSSRSSTRPLHPRDHDHDHPRSLMPCSAFPLVEKGPMVPVRPGHWSWLSNRDQLLGTNAGPDSSTNHR
jgi:hypothetical protein